MPLVQRAMWPRWGASWPWWCHPGRHPNNGRPADGGDRARDSPPRLEPIPPSAISPRSSELTAKGHRTEFSVGREPRHYLFGGWARERQRDQTQVAVVQDELFDRGRGSPAACRRHVPHGPIPWRLHTRQQTQRRNAPWFARDRPVSSARRTGFRRQLPCSSGRPVDLDTIVRRAPSPWRRRSVLPPLAFLTDAPSSRPWLPRTSEQADSAQNHLGLTAMPASRQPSALPPRRRSRGRYLVACRRAR